MAKTDHYKFTQSFDIYKDKDTQVREDDEYFERYVAENIIPILHPNISFPSVIDDMLTPYHDQGRDIDYESIYGECKYKSLNDKDEADLIISKLTKISSQDNTYIQAYIFCIDATPIVRELCKTNYIELIDCKKINDLEKLRKSNCKIDLNFKLAYDSEFSDERSPYLCNVYQSDKQINPSGSQLNNIFVSLVCIPASEFIIALEKRFGKQFHDHSSSIFSDNLRGFIGKVPSSINNKIFQTIENCPELFAIRNNGICLTTAFYRLQPLEHSEPKQFELHTEAIQVINGAQTLGTIINYHHKYKNDIHKINNLKKVRIPVKIISGMSEDDVDLRDDIVRYHNTQNKIELADFHSKDKLQINIADSLKKFDIQYNFRRGVSLKGSLSHSKSLLNVTPIELFKILVWSSVYNNYDSFSCYNREFFASDADIWKNKYYPKYFKRPNVEHDNWSLAYSTQVAFYTYVYFDPKVALFRKDIENFGYSGNYFKEIIIRLYSIYYDVNYDGNTADKYNTNHIKDKKYGITDKFIYASQNQFFNKLRKHYDKSSGKKTLKSFVLSDQTIIETVTTDFKDFIILSNMD